MSMGSHAATFVAAAVLASTTAFAQTTARQTNPSSSVKNGESPTQQVTLIGCVQKEKEYRQQHNIKDGGGLNTGIGEGNEYVLINAIRVSPGSAPVASAGDCSSASSGEAFEMTGSNEGKLKDFVGKRVEITGKQKHAKVGPNGQPTGGFDPMHGDLKLFEVEPSSIREVSAVTAQTQQTETAPAPQTTAPAPATTAPAPATTAPAPAPAPEPAPTGTSGRTETAPANTALPHTASPLALYELASLLFFGGAYGVRRLRNLL